MRATIAKMAPRGAVPLNRARTLSRSGGRKPVGVRFRNQVLLETPRRIRSVISVLLSMRVRVDTS